jgi:hypothetical protein
MVLDGCGTHSPSKNRSDGGCVLPRQGLDMPARAQYNTTKAICGMSMRSADTRDEEPSAESFFTHACAERGPLEAAPGKVRIEN